MKKTRLALAAALVASSFGACNNDDDTDKDLSDLEAAITYSTTAVKSFSLSEDIDIMEGLDAVFFSIDLDHGVIYNADSLPKGTKITHLIPKIEFQTTMSKVMIYQTGGSVRTDSVNFLENETDSIDFSGKVTLRVTSYDGAATRDYDLKVNVHTTVPDSLSWDKMAVATLPSRLAGPKEQKTVMLGKTPTTLVEEADGTFTLATASDIFKGTWVKNQIDPGFRPDIRSLSATPGALWVLDSKGNLMTSGNGKDWTATGQKWTSIVGPYLNSVLGIADSGSGLVHTHWPRIEGVADSPLENGFPLSGFSSLHSVTSEWTPWPTVLFCGGTLPSGDPTPQTWAFDGSDWAEIADNPLPALTGTSLTAYPGFRSDGSLLGKLEIPALVVLGGRLADGSANRKVYTSFDNGVNWRLADTSLQLPEFFPNIWNADALTLSAPRSADLTDLWTPKKTRSITVNGFEATWDCPYIYVVGGRQADGTLSNRIWRGVILRLEGLPEF